MISATLLVCCVMALAAAAPGTRYDLELAETHFAAFITTYNKTYSSDSEKKIRFEIFKENLRDINEKNAMGDRAVFGINMFTDMTRGEFRSIYACAHRPEGPTPCAAGRVPHTSVVAPDSFDWRTQNVVTPVKNQQKCGSCWAFSTTGNLEGQYAKTYGQLLEFSESQLVDCDTTAKGCDGGLMNDALLYVQQAGGIMSESDYPYTPSQGQCRFDQSKVVARVSGCNQYMTPSEDELKDILVSTGPLSITLYADTMQSYTGGVFTGCAEGPNNHAVLLVGYGTDNGTPYWLIKNSWGTGWGESGYIRIPRNVNACNIVGPTSTLVSAIIG